MINKFWEESDNMTKILNGTLVARKIIDNIKTEIKTNNLKLKLVIILIGDDRSSEIYVAHKMKKCDEVNIATELVKFNNDIDFESIISNINKLNNDDSVTGILLQLPLPKHLQKNQKLLLDAINPLKDVDGLNYLNIIQRKNNQNGIIPATPKGILELLKYYDVKLINKNICIIGTSIIVGQPLAIEFRNKNINYVCLDRETDNKIFIETLKNADIIISATGVKHLINSRDQVKKNVVLIDVGICKTKTKKIYGDINTDKFIGYANAITPVPGGVGPMTIAALLENILIINKW